jgi:hypothetical protein
MIPHEAWCDRRCDCGAGGDLEDALRADLAAARALLREVNARTQGTIAEYEEYLTRIDAALAGKDAPTDTPP